MLRTMELPARTMIIRKGTQGDCMYFIAAGEVEVDLPGKKVQLGDGAFFGEMALLGNNLRGANVSTTKVSRLLVLDLVDFRVLMARHPDLAETIDAEAKRRTLRRINGDKQINGDKNTDTADAATGPVLELIGARATIRLNRPKQLNRLQAEDLGELVKLFDRVEADPAIRVLVLTGTGRAFSAGDDLNSVAQRAVSASEQQSAGSAFEVVVNRLEDLGVPTICRIQWRRLWWRDRPRSPAISASASHTRKCSCRVPARAALLQQRHQTYVSRPRRQCKKTVPDRRKR